MNEFIKLYTSYFGKLSLLQQTGIFPICIARGIPKFYGGAVNQIVAPYSWMLSDKISREEYIEAYKNQVLKHVDPNMFYNQCVEMAQGKDVALLCYEKPSDFCHRHLLAEWLKEKLGIEVKEFDVIGEPWIHKNPPVIQNNLFDF